jgi:hypothetical protein
MTTEKKVTPKKTAATKKDTVNEDVVAIVAAILMTKNNTQRSAIENAKIIVEEVNELVRQ